MNSKNEFIKSNIKDNSMNVLNDTEQTCVSGGGLQAFIVGYVASKAVDKAIDGIVSHGMSMSRSDHTQSNEYFLANREKFNLLL